MAEGPGEKRAEATSPEEMVRKVLPGSKAETPYRTLGPMPGDLARWGLTLGPYGDDLNAARTILRAGERAGVYSITSRGRKVLP